MTFDLSLSRCGLALAALLAFSSPARADWEAIRTPSAHGATKFIPQVADQCQFRLFSLRSSRAFTPSDVEIIRPYQDPYLPYPGPRFLGSLKLKVPLTFEGLRAIFPQDEPNELNRRGLSAEQMSDITLHVEDYLSNEFPPSSSGAQQLATAVTYRRPGSPILERIDHPASVDAYRLHTQQSCPEAKALELAAIDAPDFSVAYSKNRLSDGDLSLPWLGKANLSNYSILLEVPGSSNQEPWAMSALPRYASEAVIHWYADSVTYKPERITVRLSKPYGTERAFHDVQVQPGLKTVIYLGPDLAEFTKVMIEFPGRVSTPARYFYPGIREIEVKGYKMIDYPRPQ